MFSSQAFLTGAGIASIFAILILVFYLAALIARALGKQNIFYTIVPEGQAVAVLVNDQFKRMIMSYRGHKFRGTPRDLDKPSTAWDVVPQTRAPRWWQSFTRPRLPYMGGIHWLGLWPFTTRHTYKFKWSSLEEKATDNGKITKFLHEKEEPISHIFVQADTYGSVVQSAECSDNVPVDVLYTITGRVVNPYKALFDVWRWLETVHNLLGPAIRVYIGTKTYSGLRDTIGQLPIAFRNVEDVNTNVEDLTSTTPNPPPAPGTTSAQILEDSQRLPRELEIVLKDIEDRYGFAISALKIESVDPAGDLAVKFVEAGAKVFVAEQTALANKIEGRGLADRATALYRAIADVPGGVSMQKMEAIRDSKITTWVEGGANAGVVVNPHQQPATPAREGTS